MTLPTPNSAIEKKLNSWLTTWDAVVTCVPKLSTSSRRVTSPSKSSSRLEPKA